MTGKLQLLLINVLLNQFLNTKVSQGSVATRLRRESEKMKIG